MAMSRRQAALGFKAINNLLQEFDNSYSDAFDGDSAGIDSAYHSLGELIILADELQDKLEYLAEGEGK